MCSLDDQLAQHLHDHRRRMPVTHAPEPVAAQSNHATQNIHSIHAHADALRSETELLIHYEKTDDSTRRLRELVATESECCSFVGWEIDDSHADLRLVVSGMPEQLAALNVG